MKKAIAIGLLSLLVLIVILVSRQPNEYTIEKSVAINKPQSEIFKNVLNFKEWKTWNTWFQKDPTIKLIYSEPTARIGSSVTWDSDKEGSGKQTITDIVGEEFIKMKLEFYKPLKGIAFTYFKFKKNSEGSTEVFLLMEAKNESFISKFFYLVFDAKSIIGKNFEQSLQNLKKISEAQPTLTP